MPPKAWLPYAKFVWEDAGGSCACIATWHWVADYLMHPERSEILHRSAASSGRVDHELQELLLPECDTQTGAVIRV